MTAQGSVYDLGYQPYDGVRLGRRGAVLALLRDGLRRVLGLRRRARTKVLPWSLLAIALLPAVVFLGLGIVAGEIFDDAELFSLAEYFDLTSRITVIFVALAAAELFIPDRSDGVLQLLAARPLLPTDYVAARAVTIGIVVLAFLLVPQVLVWVGLGWLSAQGFLSYAGDNWLELVRSVATAAVFIVGYAPPAVAVAAVANRVAVGAGVYVAGMLATTPLAAQLVDQRISDFFGLLALDHHPRYVRDWVFGSSTRLDGWIPERAGYDPWVSLLVIAVVAVACAAFVVWRYRRPR